MTPIPDQNPVARVAWREVIETARIFGCALLIALVLRILLFQPFTIPSSSMEPGLVTGDYIVVTKFDYGSSRASLPFNLPLIKGRILGRGPARGDVVVFRHPSDPQQALIKRVIGLPGDHIQVRGGAVFVNGKPIPRTVKGPGLDRGDPGQPVISVQERKPDGQSYLTFDRGGGRPGDDTDIFVVPDGRYFVMGDNRDNSLDSRWPADPGVGYVPAENMVGKARFVLMSWKAGASLFKPWTWLSLDGGRAFKPLS